MTLKPGGKYPLMRRRMHFLRRRGPSAQTLLQQQRAKIVALEARENTQARIG